MADVTSPFGFPYPEDTDLVRNGAADIEALAEGVNDQFSAGFQFAGQRIYTSNGQFEKADPLLTGDIGLRGIRVQLVASGGGGGGCSETGIGETSSGGPGGGGAYAESFITDIAGLDASVTVTRALGGTGGAAGNFGGGTGGASSFGSLVSAVGGEGGAGRGAQAAFGRRGLMGQGGLTGVGDLVIPGSAGGSTPFSMTDDSPGQAFGDNGGASFLSGSRRGRVVNAGVSFAGEVGLQHGGGGTGGVNRQSEPTAKAGGAGANGIVIVDCFV